MATKKSEVQSGIQDRVSNRVIVRRRVTFDTEGPTMAQQQFQKECDVNHIMKKYRDTGQITHVRVGAAFQDCTQYGDFQENLNQVMAAEEAFMSVPASIRRRFNNDPAELLAFVGDKNNLDEAIRIGLVPSKSAAPASPSAKPSGDSAEPSKK